MQSSRMIRENRVELPPLVLLQYEVKPAWNFWSPRLGERPCTPPKMHMEPENVWKCGDGMEKVRDNLQYIDTYIIYLPYHQLFGCHKCLFDHIRSLMKKHIRYLSAGTRALICVMRRLTLVIHGNSEILPSSCWNQEVEQLKKNGWEHLSFWVDLYGQTKHWATVSRKDQRF